MKKMLPFLSKKKPEEIPEVIKQAVLAHDLERDKHIAKGYAMALQDISHGLRGCNSFALISVAPAIQQMQGKLRKMTE